jgi:hypothetical protein
VSHSCPLDFSVRDLLRRINSPQAAKPLQNRLPDRHARYNPARRISSLVWLVPAVEEGT